MRRMTSEEVYSENCKTAEQLAILVRNPMRVEKSTKKRRSGKSRKPMRAGVPVTENHEKFVESILAGNSCEFALMAANHARVEQFGEFYVYLLIDPRNDAVFYVGKGKGDRAYQHSKNAKNGVIDNAPKHRVIREIIDAGLEVRVHIIHRTDSETEAYRAERFFIRSLASCGLTNISNGSMTNAELNLENALSLREKVAPLEWMQKSMPSDIRASYETVFGGVEKYHKWIHETIDDIIKRCEEELLIS